MYKEKKNVPDGGTNARASRTWRFALMYPNRLWPLGHNGLDSLEQGSKTIIAGAT